jgi:hypothetical protein
MNTSSDVANDDELVFPAAVEQAAVNWDAAGLLLPPVPRELAFRLSRFNQMSFGSETLDPTDREAWLARAKDPQSPNSVAFGHFGHGVNSWFLCYQLVRGPLAIFLRQTFGGIYGDRDAEASKFNDTVERLVELIVYADFALQAGRLKPGQRLILAIDEQGPSGWEVSPGGTWRNNDNPIDLVIKALGTK